MNTVWLICQEPVHIGGADSSSRGNNNPIFRVSDRTPAIPGSSLRGALRESASNNSNFKQEVDHWFGGETDSISPGSISLGWGWPVWWPVHVLGYGNWWVSCPGWLNRLQQLSGKEPIALDSSQIYITEDSLDKQTVYLRWLRLNNVKYSNLALPAPAEVPSNRRLIVPDESINLLVDMGLVRQPRVSLLDEPDDKGSLVKNLFAVEGIPPGAIFMTSWTTRKNAEISRWNEFFLAEHHLGGLWSVGYGRIMIAQIQEG
jgi:CRISPR/Cas system CMR subunit Cmr4 (Cas7 group RAMP superfamily)